MMLLKTSLLVSSLILMLLFSGCSSSGSGDDPTAKYQPESNDNPYPDTEDPWADYTGLRAGFGRAPILELDDDISGYWVAGFSIVRPASGIHDPIYAIATIIDDGKTRIGIVALDAFSLKLEDTDAIRNEVTTKYGIDHLIVHSLHNHEVPDNNGLWSFLNIMNPDSNEKFIEELHEAALEAVRIAANNIEPAQMYIGQVMDKDVLKLDDPTKINLKDMKTLTEPNDLGLSDLRPPFVTDNGLRFAVFKSPKDGHVIGTIVNWSNHIETIWKWNQDISADFVGYMRDSLNIKLGGETMFITGNTGSVSTYVLDPVVFYDTESGRYILKDVSSRVVYKGEEFFGQKYKYGEFNEENFKKAEAHGYAVADIISGAVESGGMELSPDPVVSYYTLRDRIQIQNTKFILAFTTGILEREGSFKNGKMTTETELNLARIGDLWLLTIPGELYPEIAAGGVCVPSEGDEYQNLTETDLKMIKAPIRSMMHGKVNMMMNLGGDHLGYFIPKSQWDEKEPFTFGNLKAPYGEENSIGPDAGTTIYSWAVKLLEQAQE